jgi:hypothetical protein
LIYKYLCRTQVIINLVGDDLVRAVPAGTVLTAAQFAGLLRGDLYFNVHTTEKPAGEIRGQIQHSLEGVFTITSRLSKSSGVKV